MFGEEDNDDDFGGGGDLKNSSIPMCGTDKEVGHGCSGRNRD